MMASRRRKLEFCQRFVHLQGEPIRFDRRPYLDAIYAVADRNLVLRCARQVEKSTFLVNTILFEAIAHPRIQILLVCPTLVQARTFSRTRLMKAAQESPLIRRTLLGKTHRSAVMNLEFANGSTVFVRSAFDSGDACRGLSADLLLVDELQDVAAGDLPVLQETLSHAAQKRMILVGTPKSFDNHLEAAFARSTANRWGVLCPACQVAIFLDESA